MSSFFQELKVPFFTILFIFLGLFLYTKILGPIPFFVNSVTTTKTDVFSVTGEGKATEVPDTARASLGITATQNTVLAVQNQANTVINQLTRDLKNLGVEEKNIQTTNYNIYPNYSFDEGRQRITGFTVSVNLDIEVTPLEKINDVIDTATRDGANTIGDVRFILNDKTHEELEQKARKEAIEDAKKKAQQLADASGVTLGRIINVAESRGFEPRPIPLFERTQAVGGPLEPTKVTPGESTVTISVTLTYETR